MSSRLFALVLLLLAVHGHAQNAAPLNSVILDQIAQMPSGGSYSTRRVATIALLRAAHFESGKFFLLPSAASPSFCSGATYLVLLKAVETLRRERGLQLDPDTLSQLMIRDGQRDGDGIWGRWNANGPGTARLFFELGIGRNFTDYDKAQAGDFMKIFWSKEVGKAESGHSVIFMGNETLSGEPCVRFWSSNMPAGYGEKTVPRAKIAQVVFSRLEKPENLSRIKQLPAVDPYLGSLLSKRSSFAEVKAKCGM